MGSLQPRSIGSHQGHHALELWRKNGAEVDASIVATYLMLAAENEGLATLWVGSFDPKLLGGILPGSDGYELVAMINVGYPADGSTPSAMHGSRIPMDEFVTKL